MLVVEKAVAIFFVQKNGANVWACGRQYDSAFEEEMKALSEAYGVRIEPVYFDLANEEAVKSGILLIVKEKKRIDVLVNNDAPMADKQLVIESLQAEIMDALKMLTIRERNIITAFYGIGQPEMTLEEIGVKFGLTRERVRQIKEKAIRRLRGNTKNKILKAYLGA